MFKAKYSVHCNKTLALSFPEHRRSTNSVINVLLSKRFQTPYFWPTEKWVADDSDYGECSIAHGVRVIRSVY